MELDQQLATARSNVQSLRDKLDPGTNQTSEDNAHSATLRAQVDELKVSSGSASLLSGDSVLASRYHHRELLANTMDNGSPVIQPRLTE